MHAVCTYAIRTSVNLLLIAYCPCANTHWDSQRTALNLMSGSGRLLCYRLSDPHGPDVIFLQNSFCCLVIQYQHDEAHRCSADPQFPKSPSRFSKNPLWFSYFNKIGLVYIHTNCSFWKLDKWLGSTLHNAFILYKYNLCFFLWHNSGVLRYNHSLQAEQLWINAN